MKTAVPYSQKAEPVKAAQMLATLIQGHMDEAGLSGAQREKIVCRLESPLKTKPVRTVAHCQISVLGMDIPCPLCGVKVMSGTGHACAIRSKR